MNSSLVYSTSSFLPSIEPGTRRQSFRLDFRRLGSFFSTLLSQSILSQIIAIQQQQCQNYWKWQRVGTKPLTIAALRWLLSASKSCCSYYVASFLNSSTRYTYKVSHWDVDINENLFSAIRHTHFRIVDQPLLQQAEMKKQCNAIHFASHQSRESNHQKKKTNHRTKKRIIKKPFFRVANHQKVLNHQKNPPKFKKGHS